MSPSYHHSYICGNVIAALKTCGKYAVFSELTLKIGEKDYIPDVCLYSKRRIDFTTEDIVRMTEMPLAVAEVLSPSQAAQEVLNTFKIYFEAGIKSCWLVIPVVTSVILYSSMETTHTVKTGELHDAVIDIRLSLDDIFEMF